MAAKSAVVSVVGINALARDFKKMGDDGGAMLTELRLAHKAAAQPVLTSARGAWPVDTGAHRDSVRITATRTGATIHEGNGRLEGTGWLEFGGNRGRAYLSGGRFLFPAAQGVADQVAELDSKAIQRVLDRANTWTNTTSLGTEVSG